MPMTEEELNKRAAKMAKILRYLYFGNTSEKQIDQMLKIFKRLRLVPDPGTKPEMTDREYAIVQKRTAEYFTDDELAVMGLDRWGRRIKPWPE
jgi:hypothetical protein